MNKTQLIEENMNLVYYIIKRYYPSFISDEDLVQVGMLGLCKAAKYYDEDKCKFSTYASHCILNALRLEFRRRMRTVETVSLDNTTSDDTSYHDLIGVEDTWVVELLDCELFFTRLTETEQTVVRLIMEGYTEHQMAEYCGVCRSTINNIKNTIKRKWRKFNGDTD